MIRGTLCMIGLLVLVACSQERGPALTVSDVIVFEPLPGSRMSAAYLTLTNNTANDIVISQFSSPEFASVELHETLITDGVARMQAMDDLTIPARSAMVLNEGGKHLMLMNPRVELAEKRTIAINVSYDTNGIVIVSATLQPRVQP